MDNSLATVKKGDDNVRQSIVEMAAGTPFHAATPACEVEEEMERRGIERLRARSADGVLR